MSDFHKKKWSRHQVTRSTSLQQNKQLCYAILHDEDPVVAL